MHVRRAARLAIVLSLLGMGVCAYLVFLHLGLMRGELIGGAACGVGGAFNCHVVNASSWSSLLGMPLALWGLLGYVAVFALGLLSLQSGECPENALTLLALLCFVFVALDLVLLTVMVVVIRYYCLMCFATYAINLALLVIAIRALGFPLRRILSRFPASVGWVFPSSRRPETFMFWGILVIGCLLSVGLHAATLFVSRGTPGNMRRQIRQFLSQQARVKVDTSGDPTIGPPGAFIEMIEFSDLLCPACKRASKMNTIILASHRRDTRFVFKNYPLDTTCNEHVSRMLHPGACQVAAASECAHMQGAFWPFHDVVFEGDAKERYNSVNLEDDIESLGMDISKFRACMTDGRGMEAVKHDIAEAAKIGVSSTPTFIINGVRVSGGMNPNTFDEFVAELRRIGY